METRIPLLNLDEQSQLFGPYDRHVKQLAKRYGVRMSSRDGLLRLQGPDQVLPGVAEAVGKLLEELRSGAELSPGEVENRLFPDGDTGGRVATHSPAGSARGGLPEARSEMQQRYLDAMNHDALVLASGPAGTGKTFLAVAAAVRHLQAGRVSRLVLTRPAVEAGERLGFLPGDFEAKVNPYLRPLYDALREILGPSGLRRLRSLDLVEIAPLAFMRGRTLAHSFIILDEAQNCTVAQMKMFLTRLGEGSRTVVTGDLTQTDLEHKQSGFADAIQRLRGLEDVSVVELGIADIQRSTIVQRIVEAYGG